MNNIDFRSLNNIISDLRRNIKGYDTELEVKLTRSNLVIDCKYTFEYETLTESYISEFIEDIIKFKDVKISFIKLEKLRCNILIERKKV